VSSAWRAFSKTFSLWKKSTSKVCRMPWGCKIARYSKEKENGMKLNANYIRPAAGDDRGLVVNRGGRKKNRPRLDIL
jgi:hypothetical protein